MGRTLYTVLSGAFMLVLASAASAGPPAPAAPSKGKPVKEQPLKGLQPVGLKGCDLKAVDFKSSKFTRGREKLALKNGTGGLVPVRDRTNITYSLQSVTFADTNGNGTEEALLNFLVEDYYHGDFERTTESGEVFVLENSADCKIRVIGVATLPGLPYGKAMVVGQKLEMHIEGEVIVEFGWANGEFRELGRRPPVSTPR